MNKQRLFLQLIFVVSALFFCSCSATNSLTMSVTEPAPVTLSPEIKKVGIIDRSLASEKHKRLDNLDKILSIEGKNLDKDGANEAVTGLFDGLKKNTRFSELKIIDVEGIENPGLGVFPAALPWATLLKVCEENGVDAIFALSYYDTDATIDYKAIQVEISNPLGVKIPGIEHQATLNTQIKLGWRIYDPKNEFILDEYRVDNQVTSRGRGLNPLKAAEAIIGRRELVLRASKNIGQDYALRVVPYRHRVSRIYYVRGTDNFKIGKRRAQTGNWDGAAELWEKELNNPKAKVAGRANYNMAIINEINGNLELAIDYASKAYSDYNDKNALRYLKILRNRVVKNKKLDYQQ